MPLRSLDVFAAVALRPSERQLSDKLQEMALRAPARLRALEVLVDHVIDEIRAADRFDPAAYRRPYPKASA